MGYNPTAYKPCPNCGDQMIRTRYICGKCAERYPKPEAPALHPELLQYERTHHKQCENCEVEWLCRIWVFYLGLWALCEIPSDTDLLLLRQNGHPA